MTYLDPIEEHDDEPPSCEHCGEALDWVECDQCGGEGYFDGDYLMEVDPLWYSEEDTERCEMCRGQGGWHWCSNQQCPGKAAP